MPGYVWWLSLRSLLFNCKTIQAKNRKHSRRYWVHKPSKEQSSVTMFGGCITSMPLHIFEATCKQPGFVMWPECSTLDWTRKHLRSFRGGLRRSVASERLSDHPCPRQQFLDKDIMSSKYKITNFHRTERSTISFSY